MLTSTRTLPAASTDSCPGESAVVATWTGGADPPLSVIVAVPVMSSVRSVPGSMTGGWVGEAETGGTGVGEADGLAWWAEPEVHPASPARARQTTAVRRRVGAGIGMAAIVAPRFRRAD